jgi:hypothetical protein
MPGDPGPIRDPAVASAPSLKLTQSAAARLKMTSSNWASNTSTGERASLTRPKLASWAQSYDACALRRV